MNRHASTIYAHSVKGAPESRWEPWLHHSLRVGARAHILAGSFARELGEASGLLHDAGKLRSAFQRYLHGKAPSAEHSICGALVAQERYPGPVGRVLAYVIAGHHGGLPDGGSGPGGLDARLADGRQLLADMAPLPSELQLPAAPAVALTHPFAAAFLTRMVFSALLDADFLETERFYDPPQADARAAVAGVAIEALADRLDRYLDDVATSAAAAPEVVARRAAVLARCRRMAAESPGVFSLNVPTGGGKTLSSLAFALDHARRHGLRRIIYVIPYTSIIEQTADVFRRAFDDLADAVVEHHSAAPAPAEGDDVMGPKRLSRAAENWDAPVIVTTSVQFFESLYSNRTGRCRKLHNIAESVVVLDEVQALPIGLLKPCTAALNELAERYRTTVLLCSATVPDLGHSPALTTGFRNVTEIVEYVPGLFTAFRRVRSERAGLLDDAALAERLIVEPQALCIVDARAQAADIHALVKESVGDGTLHLSAAMCPAHRREVLAEVRDRLENGRPCRLVSTTVIEAGVDVDFPVVYRAAAGIDSLAQAAGRCNRNGLLPQPGRFVIFDSDRKLWLPELERRRQLAQPLLVAAKDPLGLDTVAEWFRTLLDVEKGRLDELRVLARIDERGGRLNWPFRTIWDGDRNFRPFRLIDQETVPVIVPWPDVTDALVAELEACRAQQRPVPLKTYRALQQVSVAVYPGQFAALDKAGAIGRVGPEGRFFELVRLEFYDRHVGLVRPDGERRPEDNIM